MTVHGLRMQVAGGQGLVVAGPVAALFVADDGSDAGSHEFVSGLVDAVTAAPGGTGDAGPALIRRVGALVAGVMSRGAPTRPFALVAESADGVAVMIVGAVTVRYTGSDGTQEALSGRDAAMWVDRIFHAAPTGIAVGTDAGGAAPAHPLADLTHGAVGGGGFDLTSRDATAVGGGQRGAHAAPDEQGDVAAPRPKPRPVRDAVPADAVTSDAVPADGVIPPVDTIPSDTDPSETDPSATDTDFRTPESPADFPTPEPTSAPGWEPVPAAAEAPEPAVSAAPATESPWQPVPSGPPSDPWATPPEPAVVAGPADSGPDEVGSVDAPAWTPGGSPEPAASEPEPEPAAPWSHPEPSAGWVAAPEYESPVPLPAPDPQPAEEDDLGMAPAGEFLAVDLDAPGAGGFKALPVTPGDEPDESPAATNAPVAGPSGPPAPAALHRQDGSTLEIGRLVVLGREPQISPLVVSGEAEAVALEDEARVTSRVHASVAADDGGLTVTDLGSANGTWILQQGDSDWAELTAHEPTTLRPGGRIRIGTEEFAFAPPAEPEPVPQAEPQAESPAEPEAAGEAAGDDAAVAADEPPVEVHDATGRPGEGVADYVFLERMGKGDGGSFYLAAPPARLEIDDERVVVKVFAAPTSDDAFRRATRELRASAAANSPYLVEIFDAGKDAARLYYAMRYVPGGSLDEPEVPLSTEDVIRAVAQAARGAHALHDVGVVHNGITPDNVLLGPDHAYLANPGLAQIIAPGQDVTSLGPVGQVEYLDPLLLTGGVGSRSSDIWSIGVTLHRAVSGQGIYGEMPHDPLVAIRTVLTQPPAIDPSIPADLADIIQACLASDQAERPETALLLAEHLESLIS